MQARFLGVIAAAIILLSLASRAGAKDIRLGTFSLKGTESGLALPSVPGAFFHNPGHTARMRRTVTFQKRGDRLTTLTGALRQTYEIVSDVTLHGQRVITFRRPSPDSRLARSNLKRLNALPPTSGGDELKSVGGVGSLVVKADGTAWFNLITTFGIDQAQPGAAPVKFDQTVMHLFEGPRGARKR